MYRNLIGAFVILPLACMAAAAEKPERVAAEQLTDANRATRIPHLFPKGRTQVIEDYLFAMNARDDLEDAGVQHTHTIGPRNPVIEMHQALTSRVPRLRFGELFQAKDELVSSPYTTRFVLEVVDPATNGVVGYVEMADSGTYIGAAEIAGSAGAVRLRRASEVRAIFGKTFGEKSAIDTMETVFVRGDFHGELPVWRITSAKDTFYLGNYAIGAETWYRVKESVPVPKSTQFMLTSADRLGEIAVFDRGWRRIETLQTPPDTKIVLDELGGFVHFLEPVR